jgi:hypothetical protein
MTFALESAENENRPNQPHNSKGSLMFYFPAASLPTFGLKLQIWKCQFFNFKATSVFGSWLVAPNSRLI